MYQLFFFLFSTLCFSKDQFILQPDTKPRNYVQKDNGNYMIINGGNIYAEVLGQSGQIRLYTIDKSIKIKWAKLQEVDSDGVLQSINNFANQEYNLVQSSHFAKQIDGETNVEGKKIVFSSTLTNTAVLTIELYLFGEDVVLFEEEDGNNTASLILPKNTCEFVIKLHNWPMINTGKPQHYIQFGADLIYQGSGSQNSTQNMISYNGDKASFKNGGGIIPIISFFRNNMEIPPEDWSDNLCQVSAKGSNKATIQYNIPIVANQDGKVDIVIDPCMAVDADLLGSASILSYSITMFLFTLFILSLNL